MKRFHGISIKNFLLLMGASLAPFSYFDVPIPGGETKPLISILWFPLFLGIICNFFLKGKKLNLVQFCLTSLLILSIFWLMILLINGDRIDNFLIRIAALTAGISVAVVASSLHDQKLLKSVVKFHIYAFLPVLLYGLLIQIPGILGVSFIRNFDFLVRDSLLVRAKDWGRVTLLANEPSFASFQIGSVVFIALLYRNFISKKILKIVLLSGILCLFFTFSVTALLILVFIIPFFIKYFLNLSYKRFINLIFIAILTLTPISLYSFSLSLQGINRSVSESISPLLRYSVLKRINNLEKDPSSVTRLVLFKSTWSAGIESGMVGLGPGQYSHRWRKFTRISPETEKFLTPAVRKLIKGDRDIKPFSVLGGIFAEFGIFGISLLGVIFIVIAKKIFFHKQKDRGIMLAGFLILLLSLLSAYPLSLPNMWLLLGLLWVRISDNFSYSLHTTNHQ